MIPVTDTDINIADLEPLDMTSRSYGFDLTGQRVRGFTDAREAMKQVIYLIVYTERYQYPIYSWNYGAETRDLIGQPIPFVLSEIKRRVTEALLNDDRINDVDNWEFEVNKSKVLARFTAYTIFGEVDADMEVAV